MKYILMPLLMATYLCAQDIKSSATINYEYLDFENSVQKNDGKRYSFGGEVKTGGSYYAMTYEKTITDTKKPPLSKDLKVSKLHAKYKTKISGRYKLTLNYLDVLKDNIAITSHAKSYGLGIEYSYDKHNIMSFTQYYNDYREFKTYQSDLKYVKKINLDDLRFVISTIAKYIDLSSYKDNFFSKNAKDDYLSAGLKIHTHYHDYHFGVGAYFGKRVFALMNDGSKMQHHAMEFNKTYMLGIGKDISDITLMLKYSHMVAEELPMQNENVKVDNVTVSLKYRF